MPVSAHHDQIARYPPRLVEDDLTNRLALSQELGKDAEQAEINSHSRCGGRNLPGMSRFGPEAPKGAAGDEMALKIERVVNRSMHREKALG